MNNLNTNTLEHSVKFIKSVGPKRAESFAKIGIETIRQMMYFFPTRYLDRSTTLNTAKVYSHVVNGYEGEVTIMGQVLDKEKIRYGKKEILKVKMRDASGFFECVWFQGVRYMQLLFNPGEHYAISSKPVLTKYGHLQFVHPDFDKITEDETQRFLNTGKIIPFYRVSKELRSTNIGDLSLRKIISSAVETYADELGETLTEDIIEKHGLPGIREAIKNIHFPESKEALEKAQLRFKFEELFYIELLVALRKYNLQEQVPGYSMVVRTHLVSDFLKKLPFDLTKSQLGVLSEIRKDMQKPSPMNRLLQGDVGSGKTIVALISMLIAKDNGFQSALMAPTEILADQHYKNITRLLEGFDIKVSLLIGGQKKSEKQKNMAMIEMNESDIVIGTHALFEEAVTFNNLGLIVIDEQHRFGVVQRSRLITKGHSPDVLVMTATPIPRTLSMTVYGDLDVSVINEMPKDRIPIRTSLRGEASLPNIYKFIVDKKKEGYQSFIIYPLVKESDKIELKAAETHFVELKETYLSELRVAMVHGQMSWQEKEEIMVLFAKKEFDVLVATTVIEVGIDIPDANIIVINDAERFGLSQLHQLRGRVGRSNKQAYCILVTKDEHAERTNNFSADYEYMSPSQIEKNKAVARLHSMVKYASGFELSEIDLKLRGPGDIFGTKQSGFPELKYADVVNDTQILVDAKGAAFSLIASDPKLHLPSNSLIKENLLRSYRENLSYARIA
ncbi:MAG: ATP-dependent DNA helicase RecG [Ignavibacteria bacterium]|jgi:ATP-dependent DNA helicase RecG|nr:ATP-dependent DNA helicase RecG [Ignavibacteria bacterium]MCU7502043.1 ATP-dependent DNA helicase RecG [Ignavibacteria bacterium]MCU7515445.1 ATP-dependent DNA helicase RecG [Ignavibacteria bacterium]